MFEAYRIGIVFTVQNTLSPILKLLSDEFLKLDGLVIGFNKSLAQMSTDVSGLRKVTTSANAANRAFEKANISAAAFHSHIANISAGAAGMPRLPGGGGGGGGGGSGGRGGGSHGGNIHYGAGGVGLGTASIAAGDWFLPLAGAGAALYGAHAVYEGAKDYQDAFNRFKALNLGDQVNREADDFAKAAKTYGVSQTELMKAMSESVGLFGSFEEASRYTPSIVTLGKANSAIFGEGRTGALDDAGLKSLLKFIDRRGGFKDKATFDQNLNLAEKLITGSGGFLKFNDLGNFSQLGGVAFRGLSEEGTMRMGGLMIEQGGAKAATAMMSIYQNLIGGRTPVKTMNLLESMGLGKIIEQSTGTVGGRKSTSRTFSLKPEFATALQNDPALALFDYFVPAMKKKGLTSDAQILKATNDLLSNRNSSNQGSIITTQQFQILRDFNLIKGAMGANDVAKMYGTSASGAEAEFTAAWTDFKKQFGETALPFFTGVLKAGSAILRAINGSKDAGGAARSLAGAPLDFASGNYQALLGDSKSIWNFVSGILNKDSKQGDVYIDGKKAGKILTPHVTNNQAKSFNQPQTGLSNIDLSQVLYPAASPQ